MSTASTAGCVISVRWSSASASAIRSGDAGSTKITSDSGRPNSGVITTSASAKVAATAGSLSRNVRNMLAYCEPCPV